MLLGLGVEELSVAPYSVPLVKQIVRDLSMSAARDLARRALGQPSAAEVRALIT
jgi:phosphoenolpyruvate-protein kinase (PTS system EI component)